MSIQLQSLTEERTILLQNNNTLTEEVNSMMNINSSTQTYTTELTDQLTSLRKEKDDLENKLCTIQIERDAEQISMETLRKQQEELLERSTIMETALQEKENAFAHLQEECTGLTKEKEILEEKFTVAREEMGSMLEKLDAVEELKNQLEIAQQRVSELEETQGALEHNQNELDIANKTIESLQQRVYWLEEVEKELEIAQKRVTELEAGMIKSPRTSSIVSEIEVIEELPLEEHADSPIHSSPSSPLHPLKMPSLMVSSPPDLSMAANELLSLSQLSLDTTSAKLHPRLTSDSVSTTLTAFTTNLYTQEALQHALENAETKVKELQARGDLYQRQYQQLSKENVFLATILDTKEKEIRTLSESISTSNSQMEDLRSSLHTNEELLMNITSQNEVLKNEVSKLSQRLTEVQVEKQQAVELSDTLRQSVQEKEKRLADFAQSEQVQAEELNELRQLIGVRDRLTACEEELKQCKEMITMKQQEHDLVYQELETLRKEKDEERRVEDGNHGNHGEYMNQWSSVLSDDLPSTERINYQLTTASSVPPASYSEVEVSVCDGAYHIPLWCDLERSASSLQELQKFIQHYDMESVVYKKLEKDWEKKIKELETSYALCAKHVKKQEALRMALVANLNDKERELRGCYRQLHGDQ